MEVILAFKFPARCHLRFRDVTALALLLYSASSWFLLPQTREKPLRATVRPFELTAIQCQGGIN